MKYEHTDANAYFDKPTTEWSFREFADVLGVARVAELLAISTGNVRVLRYRGATNVARMWSLREAVEADRDNLLARLTTTLIGRNARYARITKDTHENRTPLDPRSA